MARRRCGRSSSSPRERLSGLWRPTGFGIEQFADPAQETLIEIKVAPAARASFAASGRRVSKAICATYELSSLTTVARK